jgi:acetyl esterase/lipase
MGPNTLRRAPRGLAVLISMSIATAAAAQADLSPLFASATGAEVAAVAQDWSGRLPTPTNWQVVRDGVDTATGYAVQAVSHEIEGFTHYGGLRFPREWQPQGRFPVLVLLHGGFDGLTLDFLVNFDQDFPGTAIADSFLIVAPTFRSEPLNGGEALGYRTSGGGPSPFDRDCDDAMALLTAVLLNIPQADPGYVVVLGGSRGGNVAYHLALRDPRVRRTAIRYGPTDFFMDHVRLGAQERLDTGITADSLGREVADLIAAPWLAGQLTLAQARHALISWCVPPHLRAEVPLQIHHGELDDTIPILHSARADSVMVVEGAAAPQYVYYVYPQGSHVPSSLLGSEQRILDYLLAVPAPTGVGAAPPRPATLRGWPNPFAGGTTVALAGIGAADKTSPATAQVEIRDARGRLVRRLELAPDGSALSRRWDGRDADGREVAAGVYFAALRDRRGAAPLKLVRLR